MVTARCGSAPPVAACCASTASPPGSSAAGSVSGRPTRSPPTAQAGRGSPAGAVACSTWSSPAPRARCRSRISPSRDTRRRADARMPSPPTGRAARSCNPGRRCFTSRGTPSSTGYPCTFPMPMVPWPGRATARCGSPRARVTCSISLPPAHSSGRSCFPRPSCRRSRRRTARSGSAATARCSTSARPFGASASTSRCRADRCATCASKPTASCGSPRTAAVSGACSTAASCGSRPTRACPTTRCRASSTTGTDGCGCRPIAASP